MNNIMYDELFLRLLESYLCVYKNKNNPLVSAETVHQSSTYIIHSVSAILFLSTESFIQSHPWFPLFFNGVDFMPLTSIPNIHCYCIFILFVYILCVRIRVLLLEGFQPSVPS